MAEIRIGLLEEEELRAAFETAPTSGVNLQVQGKPQLLDPLSWILIGGAGAFLLKFLVDLLDRLKGGVIIDLREKPLVIRRDRDLPFGWAAVITSDGRVKIDVHDAPKDAEERLLEKFIEGAFDSAKDVASEARKLLGDGNVEEES
jgi:hypothetical protein